MSECVENATVQGVSGPGEGGGVDGRPGGRGGGLLS